MFNPLKGFSEEDLLKEISSRKEAKESISPKEFNKDAWVKFYEYVIDTVESTVKNRYWDDDDAQYVFEQAVITAYGSNIFEKLNKII